MERMSKKVGIRERATRLLYLNFRDEEEGWLIFSFIFCWILLEEADCSWGSVSGPPLCRIEEAKGEREEKSGCDPGKVDRGERHSSAESCWTGKRGASKTAARGEGENAIGGREGIEGEGEGDEEGEDIGSGSSIFSFQLFFFLEGEKRERKRDGRSPVRRPRPTLLYL